MSAVGSSTPRVDGSAKVRGAAQYTADIEMAGMLHAKALRSPHPHAKLVSIDVSKAAALPGVIAIVTRDDLEGLNPHYGAVVEDQPVLAMDRVRCVGDIVAAVAAEEREIAEEAVELIEVEYEPLPAVFDVVDAAQAGAPIIHEERFETQAAIFREQLNLNAGGNVCSVFRAGDGDVDAGFAEADEVFENTYRMPPVQHGHIEPHVATAVWESPNRLLVHTPCQNAVGLQEQLARIFNVPESGVRVVVPHVGGGYGGKTHARLEPVTALLARKAGRPVQWLLTREEVFLTGRRYGAFVRMKTGFKRDGRLVAREVDVFYDLGAYALSGPANAKTGSYVASGPYRVPNRRLTTYAVYTNLPPAGPYRGVGVPARGVGLRIRDGPHRAPPRHGPGGAEAEEPAPGRRPLRHRRVAGFGGHLGLPPAGGLGCRLARPGGTAKRCPRRVAQAGQGPRGDHEEHHHAHRLGRQRAAQRRRLGDAPHQQHGDGPGSAHLSGADRGGPARHAGGGGSRCPPRTPT